MKTKKTAEERRAAIAYPREQSSQALREYEHEVRLLRSRVKDIRKRIKWLNDHIVMIAEMKNKSTPEAVERRRCVAYKMWRDGENISFIARDIGVTRGTVKKYIQRKVREAHEDHRIILG